MSLAETLAPEQIPVIAREYAQQLEFTYGIFKFFFVRFINSFSFFEMLQRKLLRGTFALRKGNQLSKLR